MSIQNKYEVCLRWTCPECDDYFESIVMQCGKGGPNQRDVFEAGEVACAPCSLKKYQEDKSWDECLPVMMICSIYNMEQTFP